MRVLSKLIAATALAGACAIAAPSLAQEAGQDNGNPASTVHGQRIAFVATQCDAYGQRCAQVLCDENGSGCRPTGVRYYTPPYDGYYSGREVCDAGGCHYRPPGR